jgi:hypothetical protein
MAACCTYQLHYLLCQLVWEMFQSSHCLQKADSAATSTAHLGLHQLSPGAFGGGLQETCAVGGAHPGLCARLQVVAAARKWNLTPAEAAAAAAAAATMFFWWSSYCVVVGTTRPA